MRNETLGISQTLLEFLKEVIIQWAFPEDEDSDDDNSGDQMEKSDDSEDEPLFRHSSTLQENIEKRTTGQHFLGKRKAELLEDGNYSHARGLCKVCKRRTPYYCRECDIYLCIYQGDDHDCFKDFHTKEDFGATKRKR